MQRIIYQFTFNALNCLYNALEEAVKQLNFILQCFKFTTYENTAYELNFTKSVFYSIRNVIFQVTNVHQQSTPLGIWILGISWILGIRWSCFTLYSSSGDRWLFFLSIVRAIISFGAIIFFVGIFSSVGIISFGIIIGVRAIIGFGAVITP